MNLIKAAELLKGAPDTELTQYLQSPTGDFPEYLVASEIKRRETMREKYAAANQGQPAKTSIIEELLQKDNQQMRQQQPQMPQQQMPQQQVPPEAMGIGSVPPPEGMQLTPAPMMEAAQQQPQQFYDGGVVALAGGGDPSDYQLSQMLGIQPNNMGGMSQEEMDAGRAREMAMREILAEKRMNGQLGMPDMYGDGANIGPVNLSGQYTPRFNQASGQASISQPMAGGIANIGVMGTHDASGDKISGYNASYQNPEFNAALNVSPTGRYSGRLGRDGYGVSADVGKSLERVGADYSNGQTMANLNYMPGQGSVQGQVLHRLSPDSQVSVGGQYGKHKDINARYIQQILNGELDIGGGYGDRGAYGNVNFKRSFAHGGMVGEINDYLHGYATGGTVDRFAVPDWMMQQQAVPDAITRERALSMAQEQLGPSAFEGSDAMIDERQKRLEASKKNYLPDFLINAGLNMAASKGNFLQAAASGALQGFEAHKKAKVADEDAQRQLEDSKLKFKAAQRAEKAGLLGLSNQLYSSYENARDRAIDNNRQAGSLYINAEQARTASEHYRDMADVSRRQVANQTAQLNESRAERKLAREQNADLRKQALYEKAWEKMQDARKAIQTNIAKGEVPDYYHEEVSKMTGMSPLQKQVALQRLNQRMEADYGITPQIKAYADKLFQTKQG